MKLSERMREMAREVRFDYTILRWSKLDDWADEVAQLEAEVERYRRLVYEICTTKPQPSIIKLDHELGMAYLTHEPDCRELTIAGLCDCDLEVD